MASVLFGIHFSRCWSRGPLSVLSLVDVCDAGGIIFAAFVLYWCIGGGGGVLVEHDFGSATQGVAHLFQNSPNAGVLPLFGGGVVLFVRPHVLCLF